MMETELNGHEKVISDTENIESTIQLMEQDSGMTDDAGDNGRTTASSLHLKTLSQSVGLTWKNLTYSVKDKHNKGQTKTLLSDISGYVEPGKVLCIMGPSGCGKTTLLQVLGGLRTAQSGDIFYRGEPKRATKVSDDIMGYDGNAAYIAQEDVLYGSLTCREVLYYAAKLKTEGKSNEEINGLVNYTLGYLGLESCANTLIGNPYIKGVSGGQKRRVSIGIELMGQPNFLFMDEITSGLDSTSTYKLMNVVALLAQKGHTIVMTLHQPSSRVVEMMSQKLSNDQ